MRGELIKWGGPQGSASWEKWTRKATSTGEASGQHHHSLP